MMVEGGSDNLPRSVSNGPRIGRRNFIRGTVLTGLASTVGAAAAEANLPHERGIITGLAIYDPHYERHFSDSLQPEDIPENTAVLFREMNTRENLFALSPASILKGTGDTRNVPFLPKGQPVFPEKIIYKLAEKGSYIMVGDIYAPPAFLTGKAINIVAAGVGFNSLLRLLEARRDKIADLPKKELNRRKALKAGIVFGVWGIAPNVSPALAAGASAMENEALERILSRVQRIVSKTNPQDVLLFLRDALWAAKMSAVAEQVGQEKGEKPKISFLVGLAHSGTEDFLRFPDIARRSIAIYPGPLLQNLVDINGGIQQFSSSRLFLVEPPSSNLSLIERIDRAKDRVITDNKLQQMLEAKLS